MQDIQLSGLFVAPLAGCILGWLDEGKIDDGDLDLALTSNARAILDSGLGAMPWVPLEDVESLVFMVARQLGGGAELVEWAESVVNDVRRSEQLAVIIASASSLVDSAGYVVTQSSGHLIRDSEWTFEGGRERFSVRIGGLDVVSSDLKTLLGSILSRLGQSVDDRFPDLRFDGIDNDTGELRIFGDRTIDECEGDAGESRLHRAALVG